MNAMKRNSLFIILLLALFTGQEKPNAVCRE